MATLRSLFDAVFHRPQVKAVNGYFKTFTEYQPKFTTWTGGIYEAELTRSIIESGADHAAKLKPEIYGSARSAATRSLRLKPNPWQTTPQFIKRVWTILEVNDTCLILPLYDENGQHNGYYPVMPKECVAYDVKGELWLELSFLGGEKRLVAWEDVGVLTRHQFKSDLFGDGSRAALSPTLDLIQADTQPKNLQEPLQATDDEVTTVRIPPSKISGMHNTMVLIAFLQVLDTRGISQSHIFPPIYHFPFRFPFKGFLPILIDDGELPARFSNADATNLRHSKFGREISHPCRTLSLPISSDESLPLLFRVVGASLEQFFRHSSAALRDCMQIGQIHPEEAQLGQQLITIGNTCKGCDTMLTHHLPETLVQQRTS